VIMAITHGRPGAPDERLLLGHQAVWPEGRYSTLAGFVEPGETFEDAVRREVLEEVGVTVGEVTYFGNQPWPLPASLMIGFRGVALTTDIDVDGAEIADARWFTRDELGRGCESGEVLIPAGISISSSLIEDWYGAPLPGGW
jgi:NAD+ diphosphatase